MENNFLDGRYLGKEICVFSGDWLIVYDGKYNYMVFNSSGAKVIREFQRGRVPSNDVDTGSKYIEYFTSFENALAGLLIILTDFEGFKKSDDFVYLWNLLKKEEGVSPDLSGKAPFTTTLTNITNNS